MSNKAQAQTRPIESPRADTVFTTQPVELVHISAWQYHGGGQIEWITKSQSNSASFEIQQSNDGRTWRVLSSMVASPGYTDEYGYVYYDTNLARYGVRLLYYRVRQVAQDGSYTYSPVRTINLCKPL